MTLRTFGFCVGSLIVASAASAESLDVVTGDSSWHAWQTPSTDQVLTVGWGPSRNVVPGTAFWNNWSIDGPPNHDCNIGYWLSGTGGCTAVNSTSGPAAFLADSPHTTASYLGDGTTGFSFTPSPDTASVQLTMLVQASAFALAGVDQIGWFDTSTPGVLHPLFGGTVSSPAPTPRGTVATFVPSGSYGFYLTSPAGTFLSTGQGDTQSHFAVFQLPGADHYIFGLEDLTDAWDADWDYQDAVIEMTVDPVAEPATWAVLGVGLASLAAAAAGRRRLR
jgi:hypothetical protein